MDFFPYSTLYLAEKQIEIKRCFASISNDPTFVACKKRDYFNVVSMPNHS